MSKIKKYYDNSSKEKVKKYAQYFTPEHIARFMVNWATSNNPVSILDPAVGNGVFLKDLPPEQCYGYDIDPEIISFFEDDIKYPVKLIDYLVNDWELKYSSIICNPPYNKFQTLDNRDAIYEGFKNNMKIDVLRYANQYSLFLLKSIHQLEDNGRLAYIIPTEFMNTNYGENIKKYLLDMKCLYAVINFDSNLKVFENVLTTSSIILIEKRNHDEVKFINIIDEETLENIEQLDLDDISRIIIKRYDELDHEEKWQKYFTHQEVKEYINLVPFKEVAQVKRGIATGDNDYFVFNQRKITEFNLPIAAFKRIVSKSMDVKGYHFDNRTFQELQRNGKSVYLFDGTLVDTPEVNNYIKFGENNKVHKKYLTSHRKPWYSSEIKEVAPLWISVFSRNRIKVIRNLTDTHNLTCFHGIYMQNGYDEFVDLLFSYLITPIAQEILYRNKRQYGGGLDKFEPNDLNNGEIINFNNIDHEDLILVRNLAQQIINGENINDSVLQLDLIYRRYVEIEG